MEPIQLHKQKSILNKLISEKTDAKQLAEAYNQEKDDIKINYEEY